MKMYIQKNTATRYVVYNYVCVSVCAYISCEYCAWVNGFASSLPCSCFPFVVPSRPLLGYWRIHICDWWQMGAFSKIVHAHAYRPTYISVLHTDIVTYHAVKMIIVASKLPVSILRASAHEAKCHKSGRSHEIFVRVRQCTTQKHQTRPVWSVWFSLIQYTYVYVYIRVYSYTYTYVYIHICVYTPLTLTCLFSYLDDVIIHPDLFSGEKFVPNYYVL